MDPYTLGHKLIGQRLDPERAHHLALLMLSTVGGTSAGRRMFGLYAPEPDERLRLRVWNLPFQNPLGAAAGFDKNAVAVEGLLALGFGHVEVGTLTLRPQAGNELPRVWRVPERQAVINTLGFPNDGAAAARNRLLPLRPRGIVGVNIGKNKDTSAVDAPAEYAALVRAVFDVAQYITVNVSSPNTPGLRDLQMVDQLSQILSHVHKANQTTAQLLNREPRPVLVKIAPDLTDSEIESISAAALEHGANGLVATNTTTSRAGVPSAYASYPGGLSGKPLAEQANHVVRIIYQTVGKQIPIIGVGGISSAADVVARMRSGATLAQFYTAFTYAGPALPGRILRDLSAIANREGWNSITEIIGMDA